MSEQRDVFDLGLLRSLLQQQYDEALQADAQKVLEQGPRDLDLLGRFLFQLHLKRDELEAKMGKEAVAEVIAEIELRFKALGEAVAVLNAVKPDLEVSCPNSAKP